MRQPVVQLRFAARSLARSRAFTVVAVLTLALGIGAVTAMFAVLERVVLRPLPYPDSDRLVAIRSVVPAQDPDEVWGLSEASYFHFAENSRTLDAIGAVDDVFMNVLVTISGPEGAVRVSGDSVSASLLALLGARPAHGRLFDDGDDRPEAPPVTILSHRVWTTHFGGDETLVGRTIQVAGTAREVIGIMEPGFRLPGREPGVWVPLRLDPDRPPVNDHWVGALARLRPGATVADARQELDGLTERFPEIFPEAYDRDFIEDWGFATRIEPLRDHVIGNVASVLWPLLGGVGLVLLISFANVGNLFILRAEERRGEFAIRTAHGASRRRLATEGLAEGFVVGALAVVCGVMIARYALEVLVLMAPSAIPRLSEVEVGWTSSALAVGIGCLAASIVGPLPRLWARIDVAPLRGAGWGHTASAGRQSVRRVLVASQIALAFTLLAATGLMLRSFLRLHDQHKGFDERNVLTFQVAIPATRYEAPESRVRFYRELTVRLEALPGVSRAGGATHLPLAPPDGCWATHSDDAPTDLDEPPPCLQVWAATPGYLETLGIPIEGRTASWGEVEAGTPVVAVTRAMADRFWPGEDPIGKRIRGYSWGDAPHYRVAGVTGDLRAEGLDRAPLQGVFLPARPLPETPLHWGPFWGGEWELYMVVRSTTDSPEALAPGIRSILAELDSDIAPGAFETMSDVVARSGSVARASLLMRLIGVAAGLAIALAGVGLYGAASYLVRRRTREIGLRIALGADAAIVAGTVVRQALLVAGAGVAAGLASAVALTRLLRSLLFQIHPNDPLSLAAAVLVVAALVGVATWLPARRATRIDPLIALQHE